VPAAHPTEELDCLTCSACCRGHAGVIPVSSSDLVRFKRAGRPELALRIVPGHFGDEAMETRTDGACVHLGRPGLPHHCSIYDVRPDICGEFERGSWQCHEARRFDARTRSAAPPGTEP
jgi:Fe-S-cluster containining protein